MFDIISHKTTISENSTSQAYVVLYHDHGNGLDSGITICGYVGDPAPLACDNSKLVNMFYIISHKPTIS